VGRRSLIEQAYLPYVSGVISRIYMASADSTHRTAVGPPSLLGWQLSLDLWKEDTNLLLAGSLEKRPLDRTAILSQPIYVYLLWAARTPPKGGVLFGKETRT